MDMGRWLSTTRLTVGLPEVEAPPPARSSPSVPAGSHTCEVRTVGTVACWGDNSFGRSALRRARLPAQQ